MTNEIPAPEGGERAAFEVWARSNHLIGSSGRLSPSGQIAWDAWQARAALAAQPQTGHPPAGQDIEAAVDTELGIKLLPPIRVPAATAALIEKFAALEGVIVQSVVRDVLVERFSAQSPAEGHGPTVEEQRELLKRLRHYGDNDRNAACALIERLGADLYAADGRANSLAQKLAEAQGCISGWVEFGCNVTDALGLRVMYPKQILAEIARLRAATESNPQPKGTPVAEVVAEGGNGRRLEWKQTFGAWDIPEPGTKLYAHPVQSPAPVLAKELPPPDAEAGFLPAPEGYAFVQETFRISEWLRPQTTKYRWKMDFYSRQTVEKLLAEASAAASPAVGD